MAYMTTAQALVKFLDNQYVSFDGKETKFVDGIFTIFGHGIVCGLGEALDSDRRTHGLSRQKRAGHGTRCHRICKTE